MSLDHQPEDNPPLPSSWVCPNCRARAEVIPNANATRGFDVECSACGFEGDPDRKDLPIAKVTRVTKP